MSRDVVSNGLRSGNCSCHDAESMTPESSAGGSPILDTADLRAVPGRPSVETQPTVMPKAASRHVSSDNEYYVTLIGSGSV
jgi:hypothetical protein